MRAASGFVAIMLCIAPECVGQAPNERLTSVMGALASYSLHSDAQHERRLQTELARLFADASPESDEAVVVLLQFACGEPDDKLIESEVVRRGNRVLPLLAKYREEPYPVPIQGNPGFFRLSPPWRRAVFDGVEGRICGCKTLGIPNGVWKLLQPIVDSVERGGQALELAWKRFFALNTPEADEAVVLLLEFSMEEAGHDRLTDEILKRGRRVLPFLRKYGTTPPLLLIYKYPADIRADPMLRFQDYAELTEQVEIGDR
jgi:hypothetical protein